MDRLSATTTDRKVRFLFAYDIGDDTRRTRLAEAIMDFTGRTQLSVFDGWLPSARLKELWPRLRPIMRPAEDVAFLFVFCRDCAHTCGGLGQALTINIPDSGWII